MTVKKFYHDIDLVKVGQLINARIQNVTNAERSALGLTLDGTNVGLMVFDSEDSLPYIWTGSAWVNLSPSISGAVSFKGVVAFNAAEPVAPSTGDYYIFSNAGTCTWNSSDVVQAGDSVIFNGTDWSFIQGNIVNASESVAGVIQLGTSEEINTGTDTTKAVTAATLQGKLSNYKAAKVYFVSGINLVAGEAYTINHNLALQNRNAFTINVMDSGHSAVSVDVDSVNANSLTLTSSVALTGLNITIIGF